MFKKNGWFINISDTNLIFIFVYGLTWKNSMKRIINLEKGQTQIDASWTKYSSFGTHQIYSS